MSNLKPADKLFLEQAFNMKTGYVLDFSNNTFSNFFAGYDIDIDIENRDIEPDQTPLSKANRQTKEDIYKNLKRINDQARSKRRN